MKIQPLIGISLISLSLLVHAQKQQAIKVINSEYLSFNPPQHYKIVSKEKKLNKTNTLMIPANQTSKNWKESITVSVMQGTTTATLVSLFGDRTLEVSAACQKGKPMSQFLSHEQNTYYPSFDGIYACEYPDESKSEYGIVRIIRGKQNIYMIEKKFKGRVADNAMKELLQYFSSIKLCNSSLKTQPCQKIP